MKVLFIVPCYEPGKDGVGDYTRRMIDLMGRSIAGISMESRVLSWNDTYVRTPTEEEASLRLPSTCNETEKIELSTSFRESFAPDWISLQWVSYGFHPKGLFLSQIKSISAITQGCQLHWMIHEIWLGAKCESSWKERAIGHLQKQLYSNLYRTLKPNLVTTQSYAYQHVLTKNGIQADRLPLPSNIPKTGSNPQVHSDKLVAGIFSHLHSEISIAPFMDEFIETATELNRHAVLRHAGKNSASGKILWEEWKEKWGEVVVFEELGMLSEAEASEFLSCLDVGLSMTAFVLSDKSGVNAAYLEHGIPVYCLSDHVHFDGFDPSIISSELPIASPETSFSSWWRKQNRSCVCPKEKPAMVAQRFKELLTHAEKK